MTTLDMQTNELREDQDMAEHLRTYAHFKKLAFWGAIALPFFFAFVLYYTQ